MTDLHEGGCLCGAVRYAVEGKPRTTIVCHCKFCQQRTGSTNAFLVYFKQDTVRYLEGPLRTYVHVSDESKRRINIQFCGACGSHVSWALDLMPSWRGFKGGSFDDNSMFSRRTHMWTDSCHPSESFDESSVCYPKQPPLTIEDLEAF